MSRNDVVLTLVALVLIVFSLVSAILIPRRYEDFPGRRLGLFALVSVALVAGMLGAVEIFGEGHEGGEAAAEQRGEENVGPGTTGQTTTPPPPGQGGGEGDAAAGEDVFSNVADPACGDCHTFGPAGTDSTTGPNLDESLQGDDEAHVRESIVNPDAEVEEGFEAGVMPDDYDEQLSDEQLNALVAFLTEG